MNSIRLRIVYLIIPLAIIIFQNFGIADAFAQSNPKWGGTINVGVPRDITGTDPHFNTAYSSGMILSHVLERLVGIGDDLNLVPELAERWEVSNNYKLYTFYLRKGRLFHNGREMVADDVKYSLERVMKFSPRKKDLMNIERVEIVDKYTVRVHMKVTDTSFLGIISFFSPCVMIVPREEVEKQGGFAVPMTHPIGTGPYKFVEWKPDRYVLLERFDQYKPFPGRKNGFGGEKIPYLDRIKWIPIKEESVQRMALLNKEIDILNEVQYASVEKFRTDYVKRGIVLNYEQGQSWYPLWFNCRAPITNNVKFRQACAYALDREAIVKKSVGDFGIINSSFVGTTNLYYTPFHKKWYDYDTERAKQLLKEVGYKGEEVVIQTSKTYQEMYDTAITVQSQLAAVGIKVKLNVVDWSTLLAAFYNNKATNYQMQTMAYGVRSDPAEAYSLTLDLGFDDQYPKMKELKIKWKETMDFETRKKLFEEAHALTIEGVPAIIPCNFGRAQAYWNYVKGYEIKMAAVPYSRLWGVWLEK